MSVGPVIIPAAAGTISGLFITIFAEAKEVHPFAPFTVNEYVPV